MDSRLDSLWKIHEEHSLRDLAERIEHVEEAGVRSILRALNVEDHGKMWEHGDVLGRIGTLEDRLTALILLVGVEDKIDEMTDLAYAWQEGRRPKPEVTSFGQRVARLEGHRAAASAALKKLGETDIERRLRELENRVDRLDPEESGESWAWTDEEVASLGEVVDLLDLVGTEDQAEAVRKAMRALFGEEVE